MLWLLGFEVMPWAHVAIHDHLAPHHHDASGAMILDEGHCHSSVAHCHTHIDGFDPAAVAPRGIDSRARLRAALQHGAGSLAHHGVAAVPAPPPLHQPLPIDPPELRFSVQSLASLTSISTPTAAARGPPRSSSC